jgi:hypothetical protein
MCIKIRWCVVQTSSQNIICYEESLWEAIQTVQSVAGLEVQVEVEQRLRRNPTHAEMAQALGLPEWADAVSGGGN